MNSICFITKKLDNATELLSSHESSGAGAPSIFIFLLWGDCHCLPLFAYSTIYSIVLLSLLKQELTTIEELHGDMREVKKFWGYPIVLCLLLIRHLSWTGAGCYPDAYIAGGIFTICLPNIIRYPAVSSSALPALET